jgi:putative aldouronate transport system substrate-binding protein
VMNMFSQINHVDVSWTSTYICYDTASKTFVFAPLQDGFKDAVAFVHKLYGEKLLDPEFLTDGQDQETSKMMKDKTFMTTEMYSTDVLPLNNNENFKGQWGIAMYPQNPKYGPPQTEQPINPKPINGVVSGITSSTVVSAKTKEPEAVLKLIDHQYSDDMITLMNWGIEGQTFTKQSDGSSKLSDEIMNAKDPYSVMEGYGISSSGTCRSGIVWTPQDSGVGIALCPELPVCQGGQYSKENPVKFSSDSYAKGIAVPGVQNPYTNFNADELAAVSQNMTPIATFIKENVTKFITGERALDQWDSFIKEISKQGDYEKIVQMYNDKLK